MEKVEVGGKPEQNVHVGQPEIRVEQHNALAFGGKTAGKIDGQVGFAHAAFTGSDGEDERQVVHMLSSRGGTRLLRSERSREVDV